MKLKLVVHKSNILLLWKILKWVLMAITYVCMISKVHRVIVLSKGKVLDLILILGLI